MLPVDRLGCCSFGNNRGPEKVRSAADRNFREFPVANVCNHDPGCGSSLGARMGAVRTTRTSIAGAGRVRVSAIASGCFDGALQSEPVHALDGCARDLGAAEAGAMPVVPNAALCKDWQDPDPAYAGWFGSTQRTSSTASAGSMSRFTTTGS